MLGSKTLFQNMFSGNSTELSTSRERLTRFKPIHQRDPVPEADELVSDKRPGLTEADVMRRFGPAFDRDPRYKSYGTDHATRPPKVIEPKPVASHPEMPQVSKENWFSNEGSEDIPLSVLRRALPDRFEQAPDEMPEHDASDEFILMHRAAG